MKTKTIVMGCLALVLMAGVIVACVIGGIFMLGMSGHVDEVEKEGVEFGKRTDQVGCLNEALRRLRVANKSHDLIKRRDTQLFIYGCFQTSRATSDFCRNTPEDKFFEVQSWSKEQCQKEGLGNDDPCLSVFMEVSNDCLGKTKHERR
jgi:hypothetical protein